MPTTNEFSGIRNIPKEECARLLELISADRANNDIRRLSIQCNIRYNTLYRFMTQETPRGLHPSTAFRVARHWPSETVRSEARRLVEIYAPALAAKVNISGIASCITHDLGYSAFWLQEGLGSGDAGQVMHAWSADLVWAHIVGRHLHSLGQQVLSGRLNPQVGSFIGSPLIEEWLAHLDWQSEFEADPCDFNWSDADPKAIGPPLLWNTPWESLGFEEETTFFDGSSFCHVIEPNLPRESENALALVRAVADGEMTHPLAQLSEKIEAAFPAEAKPIVIKSPEVAALKASAHAFSISRLIGISCFRLLYSEWLAPSPLSASILDLWRYLLVTERAALPNRQQTLVGAIANMEASEMGASVPGVVHEILWLFSDDRDREAILRDDLFRHLERFH